MKAAEPLGNDEAEEAVIQRKGPLIQSYQSENNRLEHGPMIPHIYGFVNRNMPWIRDYYKKEVALVHYLFQMTLNEESDWSLLTDPKEWNRFPLRIQEHDPQ